MQAYNIIDIKKNSLVFTQQKVKSNNYNNLLPFISICCRIKIMSYTSSCILSYQKVQKYEIVSTVAPSMNSLSNCVVHKQTQGVFTANFKSWYLCLNRIAIL